MPKPPHADKRYTQSGTMLKHEKSQNTFLCSWKLSFLTFSNLHPMQIDETPFRTTHGISALEPIRPRSPVSTQAVQAHQWLHYLILIASTPFLLGQSTDMHQASSRHSLTRSANRIRIWDRLMFHILRPT